MPLLIALLLLLVPAGLGAQEVVQQHTVSVSGMATVQRQPDQAVVLLAVESFAPTAREAAAANARKMDAVIGALRRLGLREDKIRTVGYSVTPEYDYSNRTPRQQGDDRLLGYRARNTVQVTTNNVEEAGTIIDTALTAGADRVTNLTFQLRDPDAARRDALRLALDKARAEAETIASSISRRLGPVVAVTTTGLFPPPQLVDARARALSTDLMYESTATPLEPGLLEVSAQVSVIYSLEPPR